MAKKEKENSFSRKEAGAISHAPDASGLNTLFSDARRDYCVRRVENFSAASGVNAP